MVRQARFVVYYVAFAACALALLVATVWDCVRGRQYLGKCEFVCMFSSDEARGPRGATEEAWLANGYLTRFLMENDRMAWTGELVHRYPELYDSDMGTISNAISSCEFVQPDRLSIKMFVSATSTDREIVQKVVTFGVEKFARWVEKRNEMVGERNVSRLRAEIEKSRRNGEDNITAKEKVAIAQTRIKSDSFRVRVTRAAYVERLPR